MTNKEVIMALCGNEVHIDDETTGHSAGTGTCIVPGILPAAAVAMIILAKK